MKKVLVMLLALAMVLSFAACAKEETPNKPDDDKAPVADNDGDKTTEDDKQGEDDKTTEDEVKVMTYEEYMAAALDAEVVIEAYVQATQGWWDNAIVVYAQDADGAYFIYNMVCSEEDAAKLVPGTKIRVKGYKTEFNGEVEVAAGATFEIIEDATPFIAEPKDVTALLGTEDLIKDMNKFVSFKGLTVAAKKAADGTDVAFFYDWDGSGTQGKDLYFDVTDGTNTYSFTVESYLCGAETDVYKAVEALKIGDKIDCEGFLYWYNGVNPHITSVTVVAE